MKKIVIIFLVCLSIMFSFVVNCFAEGEKRRDGRDGHNDDLEMVLFGEKKYSIGKTKDIENAIRKIEMASFLALDQFNGSGKDELKFLKDQNISGLPKDISEINFSAGSQHRSYTHRGWDFSYSKEYEEKAHWKKRKKILLNTVNNVFDFGILSNDIMGFDKKCDSLCSLIYYVHIVGDYIEDGQKAKERGTYKVSSQKMVFGGKEKKDNDLIQELEKSFEVLFEDQKEDKLYKDLLRKMKLINKRVYKMHPEKGFVTIDEINDYYDCVDEFLELLTEYVPKLLKKEDFFKEVFYQS